MTRGFLSLVGSSFTAAELGDGYFIAREECARSRPWIQSSIYIFIYTGIFTSSIKQSLNKPNKMWGIRRLSTQIQQNININQKERRETTLVPHK